MAFMNIHEVLITDSEENIYSFYKYEKKIKLIYYNKKSGKIDRKLIIDYCLDEYDAAISKDDIVYLVCQKIDGSIVLISLDKDRQEQNLLADKFNGKLRNLNIKVISNQVHIIYCLESEEYNNRFRIFHHCLIDDEWNTSIVSDISIKDVLNPITIIELADTLVIGYYDVVNNCEQIFISSFHMNNSKWSDKIQLTTDGSMKLYIDMISYAEKEFDLCYSRLVEGNFVVKYEKYNIVDEEIMRTAEHILSNPANCMYPTLIYSGGTLWTLWIEYNSVLSCFSDDCGISWSIPYLWEDSKRHNFARYKFTSSNSSVENEYNFNYGFGTYGEGISFIGFGDIEDAVEVPLKSQLKKKDNEFDEDEVEIKLEKEVVDYKDNMKVEEKIEDINERITSLVKDIKIIMEILESKSCEADIQNQESINKLEKIADLEKRISNIEDFINRRRRGFIRG